jgi:plastocyanin
MTTILGTPRRWQKISMALVAVGFCLALIGLRGEIASAGETAQASRSATVGIVNFAYKPGTLTVGKGSTVVFSNTSNTTHTATRSGSFTTGRIKPGKSVSVRFKQAGTFAYHCTIHPFMKGKIVVD